MVSCSLSMTLVMHLVITWATLAMHTIRYIRFKLEAVGKGNLSRVLGNKRKLCKQTMIVSLLYFKLFRRTINITNLNDLDFGIYMTNV